VKTNSLYELLSLYVRSTYNYKIIKKKNSLNNINICTLVLIDVHLVWKNRRSCCVWTGTL